MPRCGRTIRCTRALRLARCRHRHDPAAGQPRARPGRRQGAGLPRAPVRPYELMSAEPPRVFSARLLDRSHAS
ncbi:MAG: hypothetical protein MZV65_37685 [Chromatiales bacterium]|nr:hypothetical protein [Chromatiales bacterium]